MTKDDFLQHVTNGPGDCMTWAGRVGKDGYGRVGHKVAHRVAYELFIGPIPEGDRLHHRCRRKSCVNVWKHLVPVTHAQNVTFAHRERHGQMPRRSLRIAVYFHNQMTERMRESYKAALEEPDRSFLDAS